MQAPGGAFTGPTYDFIIVGAGAAGSVLAHRLVNARFADGKRGAPRVLLLENGGTLDDAPIYEHIPLGFSQLLGSRLDYGFYSREDPAQMGGRGSLYFPRGMGEGGSHAISVMLYVRGSFLDYAFWEERYGATGWGPLDVIPYFKRSESNERAESQDAFGAKSREFHGADGPLRVCNQRHPNPMSLAFLRAAELEGSRRNPDFNDWNEGQEGIGMYQVTQRDGRRESPATAFLRPICGRRNLHVETHALAERVVLDEEQRRAIGVSYIDRHGKRVVAHAACEVLLAAGAIGTPQLLMLSGIGPGEHLRSLGLKVVRDSVGVGSNLQDHAAVVVSHYSPDPFQDDRRQKQLYYTELLGKDPWTLFQYFALGTGPLTSPLCEAGGFYHTRTDAEDYGCDLQLRFVPFFSDPDPYKSFAEYRSGGDFLMNTGVRPAGFTVQSVLIRPHSRGSVRLSTVDPRARPIIHANWLQDPRDLRTLVNGIQVSRKIIGLEPMEEYRGEEVFPASVTDKPEEYVRQTCHTANALVGTARMGTGPDAVVDPQLRVHGIERLRVIDASVMPKITGGQTGAPTMMIAERGADFVKQTWKLT